MQSPNSKNLWQNYHAALKSGNKNLAKKILANIHSYKGHPAQPRGGCAKCRKKFS